MIFGAPLAGVSAMVFFRAIPVSVAVSTDGPPVGHGAIVGDEIAVAGVVAAAGGVGGGKS